MAVGQAARFRARDSVRKHSAKRPHHKARHLRADRRAEYWRFDPSGGELYGEPLAGERLVDGRYEPYPIHTDADGDIWAHSEALNLDFYMRGNRFWVKDSATGEWLNFLEAEVEARRWERQARLSAEAQVRSCAQN